MYRSTLQRPSDVTYRPLDHAVKYIVWGFGVIILLLLGEDDKWFFHRYNYPNSGHLDVRKQTIDEYFANLNEVVIPGLNITDPKIIEIVQRIFVRDRNIDFDEILNILTDCERGNTFSETGLIPCEPCEICNENQNETQRCTPTTNRICSHKQCNRREYCNNRGDTQGPLPGSQYPNCQPCTNCDEGWGGDRCDQNAVNCENYDQEDNCERYSHLGCEWDPHNSECFRR